MTTLPDTYKLVADLEDEDVFSLDEGVTWHTACIVLFGTVSVYTDNRRGEDVANLVRVDAARDQVVLVRQ